MVFHFVSHRLIYIFKFYLIKLIFSTAVPDHEKVDQNLGTVGAPVFLWFRRGNSKQMEPLMDLSCFASIDPQFIKVQNEQFPLFNAQGQAVQLGYSKSKNPMIHFLSSLFFSQIIPTLSRRR